MNTKKLIAIGCACVTTGVCAQGVVSLAPAAPSGGAAVGTAQNQAAVDTSTVKVQGRGVGATKEAALKDAYRDAIERAVGLYVDAEQMVKNDKLVNDQILTQSNAYIEKYDVVKESETDGLFTVRIIAIVRKTALAKKLGDVMPKQSVCGKSPCTDRYAGKAQRGCRCAVAECAQGRETHTPAHDVYACGDKDDFAKDEIREWCVLLPFQGGA